MKQHQHHHHHQDQGASASVSNGNGDGDESINISGAHRHLPSERFRSGQTTTTTEAATVAAVEEEVLDGALYGRQRYRFDFIESLLQRSDDSGGAGGSRHDSGDGGGGGSRTPSAPPVYVEGAERQFQALVASEQQQQQQQHDGEEEEEEEGKKIELLKSSAQRAAEEMYRRMQDRRRLQQQQQQRMQNKAASKRLSSGTTTATTTSGDSDYSSNSICSNGSSGTTPNNQTSPGRLLTMASTSETMLGSIVHCCSTCGVVCPNRAALREHCLKDADHRSRTRMQLCHQCRHMFDPACREIGCTCVGMPEEKMRELYQLQLSQVQQEMQKKATRKRGRPRKQDTLASPPSSLLVNASIIQQQQPNMQLPAVWSHLPMAPLLHSEGGGEHRQYPLQMHAVLTDHSRPLVAIVQEKPMPLIAAPNIQYNNAGTVDNGSSNGKKRKVATDSGPSNRGTYMTPEEASCFDGDHTKKSAKCRCTRCDKVCIDD